VKRLVARARFVESKGSLSNYNLKRRGVCSLLLIFSSAIAHGENQWFGERLIRFDHSYDTAACDNGTRRNQFVASMDFIIHY
jgi:hypothetical protein